MAKYLVTVSPGAPVADVGFVKAGQIFTAPEGYVPSLTFRPCDEEAKEILAQTFEDQKDSLEEKLQERDRSTADKSAIKNQLRELAAQRTKNLVIFEPAVEAPKIEDAMTLKELGELEAKAQAQVGVGPGEREVPKASPEKADRKL